MKKKATNNNISLFETIEAPKERLENIVSRSIIKRTSVHTIANNTSIKGNIASIIENLRGNIYNKLKKYEDECELITTKENLLDYIDECNINKIVAIDTETTSLDVMTTTLVGISLYTPNRKACYIPLKHRSYITSNYVDNQLSYDDVLDCFNQLTAKVVMHNALFDLRVFKYALNYECKIFWDTYIFGKMLINGTSLSAALKETYSRIKGLKEPALAFDDYFKGITFDYVPIKIGYLYAAMDAKFTYDVYIHQKNLAEDKNSEMSSLYSLFRKVEMPILRVSYNMMNRGIAFDNEYNNKLIEEYEQKLIDIEKAVYNELELYKDDIDNYRRLQGHNCKLSDPISLTSASQIAILLYDIIRVGIIDEKSPRSTGVEVLQKVNLDFTKKLLEHREITKLLTTYVRKMPNEVKSDGRVHTSFNQVGTETGRFSSNGPNLQNIPSSGNIRRVFVPTKNHYLISCDYSSQEPRIVAHLSQDPVMIQAFIEEKDFYAFLGSNAFNKPYEDCKEFYPDGTVNPEGKKIRKKSKNAFLGLCYGMQPPNLAEQLGITIEEARDIYTLILGACPGLDMLLKESIRFAEQYGYVETLWGRRRYLNYIGLSPYEYRFTNKLTVSFDPLDFDNQFEDDYKEKIMDEWDNRLYKCKGYKQRNEVIREAAEKGITIIDNTGYVKEDERKAINTKVQGTAADMTKQAMILLENDKRLIDLGFRLLLTVHDEVIGEAPQENIKQIIPIVEECMLKPTEGLLVPFKVDTEVTDAWSGNIITL